MGRLIKILVISLILTACDTLSIRNVEGVCFKKKDRFKSKHDRDAIYSVIRSTESMVMKGRIVSGIGEPELKFSPFTGLYEEVACPIGSTEDH